MLNRAWCMHAVLIAGRIADTPGPCHGWKLSPHNDNVPSTKHLMTNSPNNPVLIPYVHDMFNFFDALADKWLQILEKDKRIKEIHFFGQ